MKESINENRGGLRLRAEKLAKRFGYRKIFSDISFDLRAGESLSIAGPNGSGKSTLIKLIMGIMRPTGGIVEFFKDNDELISDEIREHAALLAPGVNPYEELTPLENISFVSKKAVPDIPPEQVLDEFGLYEHRDTRVRFFSSGMRQRLGFLLTLINDPVFIFFDEPGMNLDSGGKELIYSRIESMKKNKIIVIAANEPDELDLCDERINLG